MPSLRPSILGQSDAESSKLCNQCALEAGKRVGDFKFNPRDEAHVAYQDSAPMQLHACDECGPGWTNMLGTCVGPCQIERHGRAGYGEG